MERGFDGDRRRRFDAHELYLLSVVFDVPIAYFFVPPPGTGIGRARRHRPAGDRAVRRAARPGAAARRRSTSGSRRSRSTTRRRPTPCSPPIFGGRERGAELARELPHVATKRLREIEREYGDRLDEVAAFLKEFAQQDRGARVRGATSSRWRTGRARRRSTSEAIESADEATIEAAVQRMHEAAGE